MFKKHTRSASHKPLNWFLVLALLMTTVLPVHYHLHHVDIDNSFAHSHSIDLHMVSDGVESEHHGIDTTSFSAIPDDAVKIKTALILIIYIAVLLTIIPVLQKRTHACSEYQASGLLQIIPHFTPLLRAPPLS